jgi:hypothetical protein
MITGRQANATADRPRPPQLGEVIDRMLGKGMVIESHNTIAMLDIGLLGITSRVFIMAVGRWDELAGILGVERPRRRSTSPAGPRAGTRACSRQRQAAGETLSPVTGPDPPSIA